jgi:hypothetical protein
MVTMPWVLLSVKKMREKVFRENRATLIALAGGQVFASGTEGRTEMEQSVPAPGLLPLQMVAD